MSANERAVSLPALPKADLLSDLCKEAAAKEFVEPATVEKDFYLTRLLWALAQSAGPACLLKGGTLLSKVDLGFRRMSEDADLVLPGAPSNRKRTNAVRMNRLRDALRKLTPIIGLEMPMPHGVRYDRDAHCTWDLPYRSQFGAQKLRLEVTIRPALRSERRVPLGQLLRDPLAGDYDPAFCWALDTDEARAEKVRAACTRDAIRDFFDLDQLLEAGADFRSGGFLRLVDHKLAELGVPKHSEHPDVLLVTTERQAALEDAIDVELRGVVRANQPRFSLPRMLERFRNLWAR